MFGKDIPYGEMRHFNLKKAFDLTEEEYGLLLARGHEPETLLSFEETPGASAVIRGWIRAGHEVSVITGRPAASWEPSRVWLDRHGLGDAALYCLDKYGRENLVEGSSFTLKPEDYRRMKFDLAVEDSPLAFGFFSHLQDLRVMVFDRPWNRDEEVPNGNYRRCRSWEDVKEKAAEAI